MAKKKMEFLKLENLEFFWLFKIMNFTTLQVHNPHMTFDWGIFKRKIITLLNAFFDIISHALLFIG